MNIRMSVPKCNFQMISLARIFFISKKSDKRKNSAHEEGKQRYVAMLTRGAYYCTEWRRFRVRELIPRGRRVKG
jgi:hypothetical protein